MPRQRTRRVYSRTRNGVTRFYGDFRDLNEKQEALIPPGERSATTDPDIAQELATRRLKQLREQKRRVVIDGFMGGAQLAEYAAYHLELKKRSGAVSDAHLAASQNYLERAVSYLGPEVELSDIGVADIQNLCGFLRSTSNGRDGTLSEGSVRKHLNALSNLFRRAASEELIPPGFNPVSCLLEKPTDGDEEAKWLEVHEAALFLETARHYRPRSTGRANLHIFPIIGAFLLTGGRAKELFGLTRSDVNLERRTVTFRPNKFRGLKTRSSRRVVPLWPQLHEMIESYLDLHPLGNEKGLLFPSRRGGGMIRDIRKALDNIALDAGWSSGEIRTKMFRHTYCATRLQTLDRGEPVAPYTVAKEMGHKGIDMVEDIYGHLGKTRHRSEVVEYRLGESDQ